MHETAYVTGATGYLGGHLVERLSAEGYTIKALARRPERNRYIKHIPNLQITPGDLSNFEQICRSMEGCKIVFHVAAAMGGSIEEQHRTNVEGTRNLMLAAVANGVERIVHVSSIAVYGYNVSGDIYEGHPHDPGRVPYNITKSQAEFVVREIAEQHGISYRIIRPALIYGPRGSLWTKTLFRLASKKRIPFIGDGTGTTYPIFVEDVVDMMILLAEHPAAHNQAFNCAPDPAPTWREFLTEYARLVGHDNWLSLPILPIKLLAPVLDTGLELSQRPMDIRLMLDLITNTTTYKMDKARQLLDWVPPTSLAQGVEKCVPYLRAKGLLN